MRLLFIDGSTHLETIYDLSTRARGGMVASLFKVTDYLAIAGHDVTVLSDIKHTGVTPVGTKWLNEAWGRYDVLICNRGVGDGYPQIDARARVLWTHDLPHAGFIPEPDTIRAFACTVFMSEYAERIWRRFYRGIGRSKIIPNGVDRALFFPRTRDRRYLLYASAPNRGLEKLPFIFESIRAAVLGELRCAAYSNLAVQHPGEGADAFDYAAIRNSGVQLLDPVPQEELAMELGSAGLLLLPSGYPEICSNIILQALASGTPVITTGGLGSAGEWVKHGRNGMLTAFQPHDYMVHTLEMVRNAAEVLNDEKQHRRLINNAANTRIRTWEEVGSMWERMLRRA